LGDGSDGKGDSSSGGIAATLPCIIIMAVQVEVAAKKRKFNNSSEVAVMARQHH